MKKIVSLDDYDNYNIISNGEKESKTKKMLVKIIKTK